MALLNIVKDFFYKSYGFTRIIHIIIHIVKINAQIKVKFLDKPQAFP
jgi:hypothetical protein